MPPKTRENTGMRELVRGLKAATLVVDFMYPLDSIYQKQDELKRVLATSIMDAHGADFDQPPKALAMENTDDYLSLQFQSEEYPLRVDLFTKRLVWHREHNALDGLSRRLKTDTALVCDVIKHIARMTGCQDDRDQQKFFAQFIADVQYRFTTVYDVQDDRRTPNALPPNIALLAAQQTLVNNPAFDCLGTNPSFRRVDTTHSLIVNIPELKQRMNVWVEVQAPGNRDNTMLWFNFSLRQVPTGELTSDERAKQKQRASLPVSLDQAYDVFQQRGCAFLFHYTGKAAASLKPAAD